MSKIKLQVPYAASPARMPYLTLPAKNLIDPMSL